MNPLGTRSRADELARLLEGAVSSGGSVSAPQAQLALRLRSLGASLQARESSALVPSTDFRGRLRTRLVAVAHVQATAAADLALTEPVIHVRPLEAVAAWTQTRKAQRRIGVTAGAMAGVIAFTGVGMAATRSLPGQPFYSLKRDVESIELQLASGDEAKGSKHLDFAATRLREVKALAEGDGELALGAPISPAASATLAAGHVLSATVQRRINDTLADFTSETSSGRMLLEGVYRKTGKQEPLRILKSFSFEQQSKLAELLPELPADNQVVALQALALVKSVATSTTEQLALGICGGECFPGNAGPTLPAEPAPAPGATASPSSSTDNNGVSACSCGPAPEASPTPAPTDNASPAPTATPSPTPTSTPSPKPTASPTLLPEPLPSILPTILPTLLPGLDPTLDPTAPLDDPATVLATSAPIVGTLP